MCHAGSLGKPGHMTLSQFIKLLNYIKIQWDNGLIDVLTPSGLFLQILINVVKLRICCKTQ